MKERQREMRLELYAPTPVEFARTLEAHKLMPDLWRDDLTYNRLINAMANSIYWLIKQGEKVIGLVWLSDVIEGYSADIHILLAKQDRMKLRPRRVNAERCRRSRLNVHSRVKMDCFFEILSHCFDTLDLLRVTAVIPSKRAAARRLALKLGFVHEGTHADAIKIRGKVDDVDTFGFTQEMYRSRVVARQTA